ncbi:methylmalonyl Co-A mutase-associated GTPase MeaB [Ginsengibacter hankyongi]|uniref:Methylmalonyl Co-A mutase-associated GTPase MeaB n=1 Tax=Ginsengibacter hankyongi TaxID=2607284 RepID=A0A5J5IK18_9BACT|nr:methylmalonyl Co-A mutase-associated GTPase MeaB [Ginsengibacter hankyongi]KAA9039532.1 methylmalonyl Co-A mutase-associated GTPase MeaB [Ginsengibacter hankyongi]
MNSITNIEDLKQGDFKTISRTISLVENEVPGYEDILKQLQSTPTKIIGITGAPGAGKSSLVDALIAQIIKDQKKVAVLCVDPSSPFNKGALLGDRIRMSEWYNHPNVFIRSLASKGSLGGLHPKIIEITDVLKGADFDYIIIETVGVGQSEVDIAALADITIVVLVPEGGDVIQTMKAGLMEVADVFVVNKYDRPDAAIFYNNLKQMLAPAFHHSAKEIPVLKTIASQKEGVKELYTIISGWEYDKDKKQQLELITEKVWSIIQNKKMKEINKDELKKELSAVASMPEFNMYQFAAKYY